MKTKTATRIEPGEMTERDKRVYLAETWDKTKPCTTQCDMACGERCNGFCLRWDNTEEVVFRYILPLGAAGKATIVRTPDLIEAKLEGDSLDNRKKRYLRKTHGMERTDDNPRGTGCIYQHGRKWVATCYLEGQNLRFSDPERAVVEEWLEQKNAIKKAIKELNKRRQACKR